METTCSYSRLCHLRLGETGLATSFHTASVSASIHWGKQKCPHWLLSKHDKLWDRHWVWLVKPPLKTLPSILEHQFDFLLFCFLFSSLLMYLGNSGWLLKNLSSCFSPGRPGQSSGLLILSWLNSNPVCGHLGNEQSDKRFFSHSLSISLSTKYTNT